MYSIWDVAWNFCLPTQFFIVRYGTPLLCAVMYRNITEHLNQPELKNSLDLECLFWGCLPHPGQCVYLSLSWLSDKSSQPSPNFCLWNKQAALYFLEEVVHLGAAATMSPKSTVIIQVAAFSTREVTLGNKKSWKGKCSPDLLRAWNCFPLLASRDHNGYSSYQCCEQDVMRMGGSLEPFFALGPCAWSYHQRFDCDNLALAGRKP